MILIWLLIVPLLGGVLAWASARFGEAWPRWVSLAALIAGLALTLAAWGEPGAGGWMQEFNRPWIPEFGIGLRLGMDGLSFLLVVLTFFLGLMALLAAWDEVHHAVGFFHLNLMWIVAGIAGVFLALDLFLFYFAWEVMLIPMYFLIAIWGYERRVYAAVKFFIFTQAGGLLMLIAILALVFAHQAQTGVLTFDYTALLGTTLPPETARWLMLGFFIAFAVKLPMFPLHTWLPDAHTEAPTAGSVILAGLMLKTGAYGLIRFVLPLFPEASREFAPVAMTLGVIGILYGAILAFAQTDLKRLVAYTSVSHLGFVLLGVYAFNELGLQGAVITMIAHGLSTGALFIIVGALQHRIHTRDLSRMGGLWSVAPGMGGATTVFVMASLGIPGLGDFVGEFLTLLGSWQASPVLTVLAAIGILIGTVYGLKMLQHAFYGQNTHNHEFPDLNRREILIASLMIVMLFAIGIYPVPLLDAFGTTAAGILARL